VSELPVGWCAARLSDLADTVRGVTYNKSQAQDEGGSGLLPILRANNVKVGKISFKDLVYVPEDCVSSAQTLLQGDIVVAMSSGSRSVVGKAAQIETAWQGSFGAFCGVLRARQGIDSRYLYHFTQARAYRARVSELAAGVNINNLKPSHFEEIEVPLAPPGEQKRIAQKLDALLAQVDTLKARIDAIPALLKRFRQSVLTAGMYGVLTKDWRESQKNDSTKSDTPLERSLTLATERARLWRGRGKYKSAITSKDVDASEFLSIPVSWHRGTLDEVTWSIKDGPHFSPKYVDDGIRFISGGNIRPGKVDLSTGKYISKELHDELSVRCKPEYLDILYTKGGTTGVAAVNRTKDEFNVWVHVAVLKPLPDTLINPFFLELALNSPECYEQSQRFTHGVGNQDLGLTRMIKIVLPVPPIGEQNEIVRRVEQLFAFADHLEAKVASAKQRIDTLTQSLLAKAFRGELVPQDPNDEPASVLLERIRAQRAAAPKAKRGRKTLA
jgi:type I restriction enzyme S subunit